MIKRFKTEA